MCEPTPAVSVFCCYRCGDTVQRYDETWRLFRTVKEFRWVFAQEGQTASRMCETCAEVCETCAEAHGVVRDVMEAFDA